MLCQPANSNSQYSLVNTTLTFDNSNSHNFYVFIGYVQNDSCGDLNQFVPFEKADGPDAVLQVQFGIPEGSGSAIFIECPDLPTDELCIVDISGPFFVNSLFGSITLFVSLKQIILAS
ncbi:hypothetical protein DLAC_09892 [Tieghemostelium lacteum]|uniref:Uncharacterized protein n=1 Tax=Tieghemostelium lacteum TaxID=361077 RepID=A0A151Z5M8_TIELA|nr:hypothetical protein DLAC_09892 [Tieghemostelium lacteum]|eukprot:KYQ89237.1 hypothetical protein DLAC_09892 [Tieghemostelium lacteum]